MKGYKVILVLNARPSKKITGCDRIGPSCCNSKKRVLIINVDKEEIIGCERTRQVPMKHNQIINIKKKILIDTTVKYVNVYIDNFNTDIQFL